MRFKITVNPLLAIKDAKIAIEIELSPLISYGNITLTPCPPTWPIKIDVMLF